MTRLIWYQSGRAVDSTYAISGDYVINEYDFEARQDSASLECRLEFQPSDLRLSEFANVPIEGSKLHLLCTTS